MTVGHTTLKTALPKPSLPKIKLKDAKGMRLIGHSNIYDNELILAFEEGYVVINGDGDEDWVCIRGDKPAEQAQNLRDAGLITAEQYQAFIKEAKELNEWMAKQARRAQYEALKQEFEGNEDLPR